MRYSIFLICLHVTLMAHSMRDATPATNNILRYGFFADVVYRNKDLYPYGIEGSAGFENHGQPEQIELNHIGAFAEGAYDWLRYGVEINRHTGSPATFDGLVEKLYGGIGSDKDLLLLGRDANHISFVRSKPWGYGFATMPMAIDSFFDGTYFGDGVFADYHLGAWQLGADVMQDRFTNTLRTTLSVVWHHEAIDMIAYAQWRDGSEVRSDYASIQHSHTHGSGCDNLSESERCIARENQLFGIGGDSSIGNLALQGEFVMLHTQGNIYNNRYKIASENTINTLYLQGIYSWDLVDIGLRSEGFQFSNRYSGDGAESIATPMVSAYSDDVQYLNTFMLTLKPFHGNKLILQAEQSQEGWAWRAFYSLVWSDDYSLTHQH